MNERHTLITEALFRHRSMSARQLALYLPESVPERSIRRILQGFEETEEVEHAWVDENIYFLTSKGIRKALKNGTRASPGKADPQGIKGGPTSRHHKLVNDVCLEFVVRGRACGDVADYDHEVYYPRQKPLLKVDAVLNYERSIEGGSDLFTFFIELDRNRVDHSPPQDQVAKMLGYVTLMGREKFWSDRHRKFPTVLMIMTGRADKVKARIITVSRILREQPFRPAIGFAHADDLFEQGPHAPIFYEVDDIENPVNAFGDRVKIPA